MTVQATDPRSGWFRFLHHDVPLEWSDNVDERLEYIRTQKPVHEIAGRLAAIVRIPDEAFPRALHEARRACAEAYDEAKQAYDEAKRAYNEARRAYDEAWQAYNTFEFVIQFGPLPDSVVAWNGRELIFAA